jgi:hypothetical protein
MGFRPSAVANPGLVTGNRRRRCPLGSVAASLLAVISQLEFDRESGPGLNVQSEAAAIIRTTRVSNGHAMLRRN